MFFQLISRWFGRGARLERKVDRLIEIGELTMGQLEDITKALDDATTAVAERIETLHAELIEAIKLGHPPQPETLAALMKVADRLKTLGSDPENPVPADPNAPPAPPEVPTSEPAPFT